MFQHQNVWLPDGERHFPDWMTRNGEMVDGRGTYQIKKLRQALKSCRNFRTAVDIGAHVGLWSMHLAKRFERLVAFEPMTAFRECWLANMEGRGGVVHGCALGEREGRCFMKVPGLDGGIDSGGTHVERMAAVNDEDPDAIEMRTLDSFMLRDVDLIKIDCEGFEYKVVCGAEATIRRDMPVIVVEQKQHIMARNYGAAGTPAVDRLRELGYRTHAVLSGDYIMVPG